MSSSTQRPTPDSRPDDDEPSALITTARAVPERSLLAGEGALLSPRFDGDPTTDATNWAIDVEDFITLVRIRDDDAVYSSYETCWRGLNEFGSRASQQTAGLTTSSPSCANGSTSRDNRWSFGNASKGPTKQLGLISK